MKNHSKEALNKCEKDIHHETYTIYYMTKMGGCHIEPFGCAPDI